MSEPSVPKPVIVWPPSFVAIDPSQCRAGYVKMNRRTASDRRAEIVPSDHQDDGENDQDPAAASSRSTTLPTRAA